jgi:hypothetical protein
MEERIGTVLLEPSVMPREDSASVSQLQSIPPFPQTVAQRPVEMWMHNIAALS